jgi:hypothetical protein
VYLLITCVCSPVHSSRPNITGTVMVPRFVIPALCGHDGGCLNMIREVWIQQLCCLAYLVSYNVYD